MFKIIFVSIVASLLLFVPVAVILGARAANETRAKKLLQQAIERGHVVEATTIRRSLRGDDKRTRVVYGYKYNGRSYRYTCSTYDTDPDYTLTLYFLTNPAKAVTAGEIALTRIHWVLIWLCIFIAALAWNVLRRYLIMGTI